MNNLPLVTLVVIASIFALCVAAYSSAVTYYDGHTVASSSAIDDCATKLLSELPNPRITAEVDPELFTINLKAWRVCAEKLRLGDQLQRARIVDMAYLDQFFAGRISLYVVVLITLSGVAFAGFQLWSAFRLSPISSSATQGAAEHGLALDSTFSVEMGKISVKSSISGVVILVISFAFFFVYIEKVYTITSHNDRGGYRVASETMPVLEAKGVAAD